MFWVAEKQSDTYVDKELKGLEILSPDQIKNTNPKRFADLKKRNKEEINRIKRIKFHLIGKFTI